MNGLQYRKLRKQATKDDKKAAIKEKLEKKYSQFKVDFTLNAADFVMNDNIFNLVKTMKAGAEIIKLSGFPIDEFLKYENK